MEEKTFHLRSRARHVGDENEQVELELELEGADGWQPVAFELSIPPFRGFVCAAFLCQHVHLRIHASERELLLDQVRGEFWVRTEDWFVRELRAEFRATLRAGEPFEDDAEFIAERMRDCPISRNLTEADKKTEVVFVARLG
jgi:hypothetical protein